jgi:hypothetical protein
MMHLRNLCLSILIASAPLVADEGMWTLNNFPSAKVGEAYGFTPSQAWLDNVQLSAVRWGQGCSASFVSHDGLVMTNHHCARSCVQSLSTKEKNYIDSGFYAKAPEQELRCPGLDVQQLTNITDVTERIDKATTGKSGESFNQALKAEKAAIEKECSGGNDKVLCEVVTLYSGARYNLYKYRRYDDVRLVFAPEEQIAFFGGDPDNFMFPRYDLDVSLVRVYEDGKPAPQQNYFKWSPDGPKEGMLSFVAGHPGRTEREYTTAQLAYERDYALPRMIAYLSEYRGMLNEFQTRGAEQARISNNTLFGAENSLKVYKGRQEALVDREAFEKKAAEETALRAKIDADHKLKSEYGNAWQDVAEAVRKQRALDTPYLYIERGRGFQSRLFSQAKTLVRAAEELPKPNGERLPDFVDSRIPTLKQSIASPAPIYPELEIETLTFSLTKLREVLGPDDATVKAIFGPKSPREIATEAVKGSKLTDPKFRTALFEGGRNAVDGSTDSMILLAKQVEPYARVIRKQYESDVESVLKKNGERLGRARFAAYGNSIYPDATFTLRLSYGAVKGWDENGKKIPALTTLGGAFERATGRDPFALPQSWLDAKSKLNLATPFDASSTNDIIGGNSGSPMFNQKGEIIGLIFDGNIHSLGGDYWFDENLNRAVSVTSSALIETLEKVYGASRVVNELKPKASAGSD